MAIAFDGIEIEIEPREGVGDKRDGINPQNGEVDDVEDSSCAKAMVGQGHGEAIIKEENRREATGEEV